MAIVSDAIGIAYHSHLINYPEIPDSSINKDKSMACKCIEEIPKKIKAHCNEQKEYRVNPVEDVSFKDIVFLTHDFGLHAVLKADIALQIKGRKTPKKAPFTFVFCPFCGVKYQEDVANEEGV